jgi:hypothetical protein
MLDIGSCSDADCFAEQEVSLAGNEEIDVMEYISTGSLEFRMTVSGDLPREDWALDVDICLRGTVSYEASL